jgi:hypothetical protein
MYLQYKPFSLYFPRDYAQKHTKDLVSIFYYIRPRTYYFGINGHKSIFLLCHIRTEQNSRHSIRTDRTPIWDHIIKIDLYKSREIQ